MAIKISEFPRGTSAKDIFLDMIIKLPSSEGYRNATISAEDFINSVLRSEDIIDFQALKKAVADLQTLTTNIEGRTTESESDIAAINTEIDRINNILDNLDFNLSFASDDLTINKRADGVVFFALKGSYIPLNGTTTANDVSGRIVFANDKTITGRKANGDIGASLNMNDSTAGDLPTIDTPLSYLTDYSTLTDLNLVHKKFLTNALVGFNGAYLYIAYADDIDGGGFSETNFNKDFIAILKSNTPISPRNSTTFAGLWTKYKGSTLYTGASTPTNLVPVDAVKGDYYLKSDGNYYRRDATTWTFLFSLKGDPGIGGADAILTTTTKTSNQTITNNAETVVTWNSELSDTDTIHDNTTLNSRFSPSTSGYYTPYAQIVTSVTQGGKIELTLKFNETDIIGYKKQRVDDTTGTDTSESSGVQVVGQTRYYTAGIDYAELFITQTTGGSIDLLAGAANCWFSFVKASSQGLKGDTGPAVTTADTNTVHFAIVGSNLTANLNYIDSTDIDFSDSVSGVTGVLKPTGVTAGTYDLPSLQVDVNGRILVITNGASANLGNIAFLNNVSGNDGTAVLGNFNKPYATLEATLAAVPDGGVVWEMAGGTYNAVASTAIAKSVTLLFNLSPVFNSATSVATAIISVNTTAAVRYLRIIGSAKFTNTGTSKLIATTGSNGLANSRIELSQLSCTLGAGIDIIADTTKVIIGSCDCKNTSFKITGAKNTVEINYCNATTLDALSINTTKSVFNIGHLVSTSATVSALTLSQTVESSNIINIDTYASVFKTILPISSDKLNITRLVSGSNLYYTVGAQSPSQSYLEINYCEQNIIGFDSASGSVTTVPVYMNIKINGGLYGIVNKNTGTSNSYPVINAKLFGASISSSTMFDLSGQGKTIAELDGENVVIGNLLSVVTNAELILSGYVKALTFTNTALQSNFGAITTGGRCYLKNFVYETRGENVGDYTGATSKPYAVNVQSGGTLIIGSASRIRNARTTSGQNVAQVEGTGVLVVEGGAYLYSDNTTNGKGIYAATASTVKLQGNIFSNSPLDTNITNSLAIGSFSYDSNAVW